MAQCVTTANSHVNLVRMPLNNRNTASTHFGRQMRKERLAHSWSLREFCTRTGIDMGQASRIENGKEPPSAKVADACDLVFPERKGWFREYYDDSKSWTPAGFRSWTEYEDKAVKLCDWWPSVISGLLQTEDYARAHSLTYPDATPEIVTARVRNRMERQRRVLLREDPPEARFIVDHTALYRLAGSPHVMAAQMHHLLEVAALPNITIHVLPSVVHPATPSGFMITDAAAYAEYVAGGLVFTEGQTPTILARLFDSLRNECYRVSESLAIIGKAEEVWTGESQASAVPTAGPASKSAKAA